MPEMDGLDLAAAVRADPRLKNLPIVFMTATVHVEHIAERTVGGPTAYLYKPFGPAALRELLDSLAARGGPSLPAGRAASPSRGDR